MIPISILSRCSYSLYDKDIYMYLNNGEYIVERKECIKQDIMINIQGKYGIADVFTDNINSETYAQILNMMN